MLRVRAVVADNRFVIRTSRVGQSAGQVLQNVAQMQLGIRDLRTRTGQVIDAVQAGERVVLTVHGEPVADIVPHARRGRWLRGPWLSDQLAVRVADAGLGRELERLAGHALAEL